MLGRNGRPQAAVLRGLPSIGEMSGLFRTGASAAVRGRHLLDSVAVTWGHLVRGGEGSAGLCVDLIQDLILSWMKMRGLACDIARCLCLLPGE